MSRFALILAALASPAGADCAPDRVTVTGEWGQARFLVELADDPQERNQGLMWVEEMPTMQGMLFIYDQPQTATFWMKNTLIPLDMIFARADGTIMTVHSDAVPLDETTIFGGDDITAVLEVNGGMADRLGIAPGDILQHPAFGANAARPCAQ